MVNVVPAGPEGGEALVGHPGIDKIHFTGSGATARKIIEVAQRNLTPLGLELGGKSANLVFADADLPAAAQQAIHGFLGIPTSVPFGGVKQSGQGRLGGLSGIREFTHPKNVWIAM